MSTEPKPEGSQETDAQDMEKYYHTLGTDGESEAKEIAIRLQQALGYISEIVQTARIEWVAQFVTDHCIEGEEEHNLEKFAVEVDAELLINFTNPCEPW